MKYLQQKKTLITLLLSILVIVSLIFAYALPLLHSRGVQTKQELVSVYLNALTRKDSHAIQQLIPSDYKSNDAISREIKTLGGDTFEGITTSFVDSGMDNIWHAVTKGKRIDSFSKQVSFTMTLTLRVGQEDQYQPIYDPKNPSITPKPDKWFLLLGKQKLLGPPINEPSLKIRPR